MRPESLGRSLAAQPSLRLQICDKHVNARLNIRPVVTSFLPRHTLVLQAMGCTRSKDAAEDEDAKALNLTTLRFANVVDYHEMERQKMRQKTEGNITNAPKLPVLGGEATATQVIELSPHSADSGRANAATDRLPAAGGDLWGCTASTPHCAPAAPQMRPGSGHALPSALPPLHLPPRTLRSPQEQQSYEQRQIEDVVKAIGQQMLESFGHHEDGHEDGLHLTAPNLEVMAN